MNRWPPSRPSVWPVTPVEINQEAHRGNDIIDLNPAPQRIEVVHRIEIRLALLA